MKRRCSVCLQTPAIDARRVGAIQVSEYIGAIDILQSRVNTRDCITVIHTAQVHIRWYTAQVMDVTSHNCLLHLEFDLRPILEGEYTPDYIRIIGRLFSKLGSS